MFTPLGLQSVLFLCEAATAGTWALSRPGARLWPAPAECPPASLSSSSRLQHIMAEMVSTEREYVRSLGYVIDNYFPEMERTDLPQDLRGKHSIIFGNLEKLYDFHHQHFLAELERCRPCPLAAGRGFLRHVSPSFLGAGTSVVDRGAINPGCPRRGWVW